MPPVLPQQNLRVKHARLRERASVLRLAHHCVDVVEGLEHHGLTTTRLTNERKVRPSLGAHLQGFPNIVAKPIYCFAIEVQHTQSTRNPPSIANAWEHGASSTQHLQPAWDQPRTCRTCPELVPELVVNLHTTCRTCSEKLLLRNSLKLTSSASCV